MPPNLDSRKTGSDPKREGALIANLVAPSMAEQTWSHIPWPKTKRENYCGKEREGSKQGNIRILEEENREDGEENGYPVVRGTFCLILHFFFAKSKNLWKSLVKT
jgi:hypothetical protein